ncbi:ArnT family glycosyltransferase [Terriglobus saanensis]|uniref:ArnT family glycosyltransferase n=1 Tax=Terriglobus saanensis TaxID=870903 RepID=UPI0002D8EAAC|nr:glycosyltransferase family 39 protein [Terriglobus saanensis]
MNAPPALTHPRRARSRSVAGLVMIWLILHLGCLFSPGLLDDVDSVYIEVAREMMLRHDYVTPYIDGVRFFDKPPLMYWMAAGSMQIFGAYDWAARLPLSLMVLALFLTVYALGVRFFGERGGFYSALAMATSLGPYLFTRFYIPDIMNALWMTIGVHLFLMALDRVKEGRSARWPAWGFAAAMALNLLTKGLIGIVFPIGFVVFYLLVTRQVAALKKMWPGSGMLLFLAIALPWHVLAALRNPAIAMPAGLGLPARAGWLWFYIVNEHFMRFRGLRIPHDYGQVPIPLFWLMFFLWLAPWTAFLPSALLRTWHVLRRRVVADAIEYESSLALLLWAGMVLGFFTLSSRQEYYSLPALPALALMAGGVLNAADRREEPARKGVLRGATWALLPLATLVAIACAHFAMVAPKPPAGADLADLLTINPDQYNLALGHLYDLTGRAMGFFLGPLWGVAVSMLGVGLGSWWLRRSGRTHAANLVLGISMCGVLLCVHSGLDRFYPILGSKGLAEEIARVLKPGDRIMLDGELTSGSTLIFYTRQPVSLVNGHVNGPWFGSFWPDAPRIFETDDSLRAAWAGKQRIFLMTYNDVRRADLERFGPVHILAQRGGKTVLSNQ